MGVHEEQDRTSVKKSLQKFYESAIYTLLESGVEHRFELEFNHEGKTGFIDFLYYDQEKEGWVIVDFKTGVESEEKISQYQEQLDFYKNVMEVLEYKIVDTQLIWL
jgi:ATP-dependent exoDNAse (exonuclease V) beta subunit